MKTRCLLVVLVVALSVSVAVGGFPTGRFRVSWKSSDGTLLWLTVVDKKLTVVDRVNDAGIWYIDGTRIKAASGDGYLAYDLSGKDNKVFLVPKPGDNTEWEERPDQRLRVRKIHLEGYRSYLSPARGKLSGKPLRLNLLKPQEGEKQPPVGDPILGGDDTLPRATAFQEVEHR
jgi:hypothetical protein